MLHPEAIAVAPDGKNVYVISENDGVLSQFGIDPGTGKITPLSPATVTLPPGGSLGLAVTPDAGLSAGLSAPATVRPGRVMACALKVFSAGPAEGWQATVTDHLPAGTALRGVSAGGGHCAHPSAGTRGATVKCTVANSSPGAGTGLRE